jgi:guanine deaminase
VSRDATASSSRGTAAFRGSILHFHDDPGDALEPGGPIEWLDDGALVVRDGCVAALGEARSMLATLPADTPLTDYSGKVIVPGFVDTHVHYAQTDIVVSYGAELLDWLERYAFPAERAFADPAHARQVAEFFCDELLANGTTTALVFATVHRHSADAIFAAAAKRGMRLVAGKVMMDRNCPEWLRDTPESSYEDSKALIASWHGRDRLEYAVTPRFAASSSEAQLRFAGRLCDEHPGVLLQSHLAENRAEVEWIRELFPAARSYLDVYDRFGLLRPRAVYAHCIHIDRADRERMAATGTAAAFCPSSNLFLGSGLFDLREARETDMGVGLGSDVGGGTSLSMLRTLHDAYKVVKLSGQTLAPWRAFYLATLGGARALGLDGAIGNFAPGKEADFVVLDPRGSAHAARRIDRAQHPSERLFALMMLGDDRFVVATHVLGELCTRSRAVPSGE